MDSIQGEQAGQQVVRRLQRQTVATFQQGRRVPAFPIDKMMQRHAGAGLARWLRQRPIVWSGWPTSEAVNAWERSDRMARLARHGFPVQFFKRLADVRQVDFAVAFIRAERRAELRRQIMGVE